jgi:excisionase family DNA binding protein
LPQNDYKKEGTNKMKLLTVKETAEIFGVSLPTMYNLINSVGFPCVSVGRGLRVPEDLLNKWIIEQAQST